MTPWRRAIGRARLVKRSGDLTFHRTGRVMTHRDHGHPKDPDDFWFYFRHATARVWFSRYHPLLDGIITNLTAPD